MKNIMTIIFLHLICGFGFTGCQQPISDSNQQNSSESSNLSEHFNIKIAEVVEGDTVLVNSINELIIPWQEIVGNGLGKPVEFNEISINSEESRTYLVAVDYELGATSAIELVFEDDSFFEMSVAGGSSTCTCTGCWATGPSSATQCQPKQLNQDWYCTECLDGSCLKTVTATSGPIL